MKKMAEGKKMGGKMGGMNGMMNKMMPASATSFIRKRPKKK